MEDRIMKTQHILILIAMFFLSACEKARLDQEVDRLCRIDGGIRVYETVKLAKEDYDEKRRLVFPQYLGLPDDKGRFGDKYISTMETKTIKSGDPDLRRTHIRIVRIADGKTLGELVAYSRRGGDIPSPFHPSYYSCPDLSQQPDLIHQVFNTGEAK
jgi:hypothetical protein